MSCGSVVKIWNKLILYCTTAMLLSSFAIIIYYNYTIITLSVTWPFDSPCHVVYYRWSIVTMSLFCILREIWSFKRWTDAKSRCHDNKDQSWVAPWIEMTSQVGWPLVTSGQWLDVTISTSYVMSHWCVQTDRQKKRKHYNICQCSLRSPRWG